MAQKVELKWSSIILYTLSNVKKSAPLSAGVYRLSFEKDDKLTVFYVGQADNLDKRLSEHLSDEEQNDCIRRKLKNYTCHFRFAKVASQGDRDCAERALYDHYDEPECNIITPPGEPCDINFT